MSICEDICEKSLRRILHPREQIKRNYRPWWLKNPATGKNLEYDFYLPRCRVALEIQGQHHYEDEEQKTRDQLKRKLSKENGIVLLEFSTIQIGPIRLYRRLLNLSLRTTHKATLLKFDSRWSEIEKGEVRRYRTAIKSRFSRNSEAVTAPHVVAYQQHKKQMEHNLKFLNFVEITYRERKVRAVIVEILERKLKLRILGRPTTIYYSKKKILKDLGGVLESIGCARSYPHSGHWSLVPQ